MAELKGERNRVVVRFKSGRMLKGYTHDFKQMMDTFHLVDVNGGIHDVRCADLKAVFFVRTLEGRKGYVEKTQFSQVDCSALKGLKMKLTFTDGELIRGFSLGYGRDRKGFYLIPIDPRSNNERIYVITDAVREVKLGSDAEK
jgi:Family of unknown function (DUF6982)